MWIRACLAAAGVMGLAGVACGVPRDSVTLTNVASGSPATTVGSVAQTAQYSTQFMRVQGTLQRNTIQTTPPESMLMLVPVTSNSLPLLAGPLTGAEWDANFRHTVDLFVAAPKAGPGTSPTWQVRAFERVWSLAPNPDAVWTTLTITLNDGPPAASNLGPVEPRNVGRSFQIGAGQTVWFRFDVPTRISGSAYLDIDTVGSNIGTSNSTNDTVLVLYDENGQLVATNDDILVGQASVTGSRLSLLSFGAGGGATGVTGATAAGQYGTLQPGTYWLAVKGFSNTDTIAVGWDVASSSTRTGAARLNLRSNAGMAAWCAGDFNRDDTKNVADIFAFLSSWFAGCP